MESTKCKEHCSQLLEYELLESISDNSNVKLFVL